MPKRSFFGFLAAALFVAAGLSVALPVPAQATFYGKITIIKDAVPDDPKDFKFTLKRLCQYGSYWYTCAQTTFELDDDPASSLGNTWQKSLLKGTYSVTEGAASGFTLTSIVCDDPSGDTTVNLTNRQAAIKLAAYEHVTCVFTNTKLPTKGRIIVDKVTDPAADPQSFNFTTTGSGYSGFSLTDQAAPNEQELEPGTYGVAETVPAGWTLTSATCSDSSPINAISLQAGETVTCTFVNTKQPPPPPPAAEACSPGYWKNHLTWPSPYTPATLFSAVFEDAFPGQTLLQVLQEGGGDLTALGRQIVAALLNAAALTGYPLTPQQAIDAFNAVFPGGNYSGLRAQLEGNGDNCPLGGAATPTHNQPAEPAPVTVPPVVEAPVPLGTPAPPAAVEPSVPAPAASVSLPSRGSALGFWYNWKAHGVYSEDQINRWLAEIDAGSAWLLTEAGFSADPAGLKGLIAQAVSCSPLLNSCARAKLLAQYLVLRLSLASGYRSLGSAYNLSAYPAALTALGLAPASPVSVAALVGAFEAGAPGADLTRFELLGLMGVLDLINHAPR